MSQPFFGGQFFGGGFFAPLEVSGGGTSKKKKKHRVIRFSDLDAREALLAHIAPQVEQAIPEPVPIVQETKQRSDTQIPISAKALLDLQEMDEEMLMLAIIEL